LLAFAGTSFSSSAQKDFTLATKTLSISISPKGKITSLKDLANQKEYLAPDSTSWLLRVRADGRYYNADVVELDTLGRSIQMMFNSIGIMVEILYQEKQDYLFFYLRMFLPPERGELITWGPINTSISKTIGETVGVVRDDDFALGLQCLNLKTLGGYPAFEDDHESFYTRVSAYNFASLPDSTRFLYRGSTARPTSFGSKLQAYAREREQEKVIPVMEYENVVVPQFSDGGAGGSSIALFGCRPDSVLTVLERMEIAENLPHPTINGKWAKTSKEATASYLILDYGESNIDQAIAITKKAGLSYLYQQDPFESWGHFKLKPALFPNDREGLKKCVDKASLQGIRLGVHTLSNFITTNDAYVIPAPDERLGRIGSTMLSEEVNPQDTSIALDDITYFKELEHSTLKTVLVDQELITFRELSSKKPWRMLGCQRGRFGTEPGVHAMGAVIHALMDHPYKTFLTNTLLADEVAGNLANLFNETGLRQISFDGLEGLYSTGMGQYARNRFVQQWYDQLRPELRGQVINDASMAGHYHWHIFTRMNWGEPWNAGFREGQTQYRLINQDYFQRNYIPAMLGWFQMTPSTSVEDIEWLLARSAGYNAGFALVSDFSTIDQNGISQELFARIKGWEDMRMSASLPEPLKAKLRDGKNEFHLEAVMAGSWNLFEYQVARKSWKRFGTAKPATTEAILNNNFGPQALQFLLQCPDSSSINSIVLKLNGKAIALPVKLKAGESLKYTGKDKLMIFSKNWKLIQEIKTEPLQFSMNEGENKMLLNFDANIPQNSTIKAEFKVMSRPDRIAVPQSGSAY